MELTAALAALPQLTARLATVYTPMLGCYHLAQSRVHSSFACLVKTTSQATQWGQIKNKLVFRFSACVARHELPGWQREDFLNNLKLKFPFTLNFNETCWKAKKLFSARDKNFRTKGSFLSRLKKILEKKQRRLLSRQQLLLIQISPNYDFKLGLNLSRTRRFPEWKDSTVTYQMKSLQWQQKVGCLKNLGMNLWFLTS